MSTKKPAKKAATNGSAVETVVPDAKVVGDQTGDDNSAANAKPKLTPEAIQKISELRGKVQSSVGQVVLAMMNLPRYKNQSLGDLNHLILEPLLQDRLVVASAKLKDGEKNGAHQATAGLAIWASVSDEVDAKIQEQIKGGAFPVRLSKDDWTSGEKLWLLDIIAFNQKLATAVFVNFKQIAKEMPFSVHPIVARSVDPSFLEKMKAGSKGKETSSLTENTETKGEA